MLRRFMHSLNFSNKSKKQGRTSDSLAGEKTKSPTPFLKVWGLIAGAGHEIRTRDFNLGKVALYH